jgi:WD40 repeat protein
MSGAVEAPRAASSPYKGLTHFTEDDFGLFFGRARERDVIVANLKARRLTLLYGESGVGKSSLLRAGVMRALRDDAQRDFDDDDVGRPEYVPAIVASWSGEPLQTLLDGLASAAVKFIRAPLQLPPSPRLDATIDALAAQADARMLVILDQLEDYFLYHGDEAGEETLAAELPRALARPHLRASFLLSIRADALAKLDRFKRDVPELFDTVLAIGPLDREAARQAIVGPLRAFDGSGPKDAEPALVEAVLDQVAAGQLVLEGTGRGQVQHDGNARGAIEAPYLQLVLERVWEEESDPRMLRLETLTRLGGAEAIVRRHLDEALGRLPEPERLVAAEALRYLVTPSGTKIALAAADLASFTGRHEVGPVLERLTGERIRILRAVGAPASQPGPPRYEIFHDVLGAAVLDWRSRYVRQQERLEVERRAAVEREQLELEKQEAERREQAERRRARTFRTLAGIAFVLLLAASALLAYALVQKRHAEHEQRVSEAQALAAEARNFLHDGRLDAAIPLALAAYDQSQDTAAAQDALLDAAQQSTALRRLMRFQQPVGGMAVDPLGSVVAAAVDRTVVLRTIGGAFVARVREPTLVFGVAFSADGRYLAAGRFDGAVALFRVRRDRRGQPVGLDRLRALTTNEGTARSVAFGPGGRWIAAGTDGGVVVWRLHRAVGGAPRLLRPAGKFARAVAFCAGSAGKSGAVAAAFSDGRVVFWPSPARRVRGRTLGRAGPSAGAVACSPDGTIVAAGGDDKLVTLFHLDGRRERTRLAGHAEEIEALSFSGDGRTLASGSDDHSVILWDVRRARELEPPLRAHTEPVVAVGFDRRATTLGVASSDGRVSVWDADAAVRAGGGIEVARDHLNNAAFGGDVFAAVTSGRDVLVRSAAHPDLPGRVPEIAQSRARRIAVDAGGRWVALGFPSNVWLFRLGRGKPTQRALGGQTAVASLALARDGTLAGTLAGGAVRVWRAPPHSTTYRDLQPRGGVPPAPADALAIAPDGRSVSAAYGSRVILWRPGQGPVALRAASGPVVDLEFGSGGTMLAAAAGKAVAVWDVETARPLMSQSAGAEVKAVAFSPDGGWLASIGADTALRLWDIEAGRQLGDPLATRRDVAALAFAGHSRLAAAYFDGTAAVWILEQWRIETRFAAIRDRLLRAIGGAHAARTAEGTGTQARRAAPRGNPRGGRANGPLQVAARRLPPRNGRERQQPEAPPKTARLLGRFGALQ